MLPLWPSINPSLIGSLLIDQGSGTASNEEQEINALEEEQQTYLNLVEAIAQDITPLGKLNSEPNNEDSDESGESDGAESSASEEGDVDDHDESDNDNEHIELSQ